MKMTSYDIIRKPVITEKTMNDMAQNKYTFIVDINSNKSQIKRAVKWYNTFMQQEGKK